MKHLLYYTCIALSVISVRSAGAQSIDYSSYESLFNEPVTASANGTPQRLSDVPLNMSIITADDIAQSPARNIPELLRFQSGVNVVQSYSGSYDVSIRGYNQSFANRILVLVNGRQVYLDLYGYIDWNLVPVQLDEIKQIEIVRGPNTALFGFNAVSGVINIITYNPLYDNVSGITARAGNKQYTSGSYVQTVKPNDKIGIRLSAGGYKNDDTFYKPANATEEDLQKDNAYARTAQTDILVQLTDSVQWGTEFTAAGAKSNQLAISYSPSSSDNETYSWKTFVLADTDAGLIEGKIYQNSHDADWLLSDKSNPVERLSFQSTNTVTVASLSDTFKAGTDHIFRIAGEYRYNKAQTYPYDNGSETNYSVKSFSGLWNWDINPDLSFNLAGRFDRLSLGRDGATSADSPFSAGDFNRDLNEFSYNAGTVYKATENDTLRFSVARGIDVPSLIEFGIQLPVAGGFALFTGNPYLKASTVDNYEISLNHDFKDFDASAEFAIFHQETQDIQSGLVSTIAGVPEIYLYGSAGKSSMSGFELSGQKKISDIWSIAGNYNFVLINDETSPVLNYDESYPEHIINFTLNRKSGDWTSQFNTSYRSRHFAERENVTPSATNTISEIHDTVLLSFKTMYEIDKGITVSLNGLTSFEGDFQQTALGENDSRLWGELNIKF